MLWIFISPEEEYSRIGNPVTFPLVLSGQNFHFYRRNSKTQPRDMLPGVRTHFQDYRDRPKDIDPQSKAWPATCLKQKVGEQKKSSKKPSQLIYIHLLIVSWNRNNKFFHHCVSSQRRPIASVLNIPGHQLTGRAALFFCFTSLFTSVRTHFTFGSWEKLLFTTQRISCLQKNTYKLRA